MISDISVIEFCSAFAKKARMGIITEEDFQETIMVLVRDIQSGSIQLAYFGEKEKREAAELIRKYGLVRNLRTLDSNWQRPPLTPSAYICENLRPI